MRGANIGQRCFATGMQPGRMFVSTASGSTQGAIFLFSTFLRLLGFNHASSHTTILRFRSPIAQAIRIPIQHFNHHSSRDTHFGSAPLASQQQVTGSFREASFRMFHLFRLHGVQRYRRGQTLGFRAAVTRVTCLFSILFLRTTTARCCQHSNPLARHFGFKARHPPFPPISTT